MIEKPTYPILIPTNIIYNKNLIHGAKFLYGEICALCNKKGFYVGRKDYFASLYNVTINSITEWLYQLEKLKYIILRHHKIMVTDLINKNLDGFGYGFQKCSWCKIKTTILHKHHYPIPKRKGGNQIIKICPNCHSEFHSQNYQIEIINKLDVLINREYNK